MIGVEVMDAEIHPAMAQYQAVTELQMLRIDWKPDASPVTELSGSFQLKMAGFGTPPIAITSGDGSGARQLQLETTIEGAITTYLPQVQQATVTSRWYQEETDIDGVEH